MQFLVIVDIYRDHHHDRGRRDADEKREVRYIYSPRNLVAHSGDHEPVDNLLTIGVEPQQRDRGEHAHPGVIAPIADEGDPRTTPEEDEVVASRGDHEVESELRVES